MSSAVAPGAFAPEAGIVEVVGLTKRFGPVHAVTDLTLHGRARPRDRLPRAERRRQDHDAADAPRPGHAELRDGHDRRAHLRAANASPARVVGAALEASSFHPGRTARDHLRVYAPQVGVGDARCDEVLGIVGLAEAADRRTGGFSMGMRQRLALATTLLGDPQVLLLDEPANGLDPEGIAWLRQFLRYLAAQGRTVLVSSHVLSEVEQTVDDVVIIARGRLVHASSLAQLEAMARPAVRISSPDAAGLAALVAEQGWGPTTRFDSPSTAVVFDRHCPAGGGRGVRPRAAAARADARGHQPRVAVPPAHRRSQRPARRRHRVPATRRHDTRGWRDDRRPAHGAPQGLHHPDLVADGAGHVRLHDRDGRDHGVLAGHGDARGGEGRCPSGGRQRLRERRARRDGDRHVGLHAGGGAGLHLPGDPRGAQRDR